TPAAPAAAAVAPPRRAGATIPPAPVDDPLPHLRPITAMPAPRAFIALVEEARRRNATDLHVASTLPPMARGVDGLTPLGDVLDAERVDALLLPLLSPAQRLQLETRGYADTAVDLGEVARLRANLSRTRLGLKGSFRVVLPTPPTLDRLGLPPELARVTSYHQGLVVIAGPNGHGKTTTLAALVDLINRTRAQHILTVEDPVEILHPRKRAVISQREVGRHTRSFAAALKASLREDPDVIVIGELRDRETVEIALTAAETGHLVMATMSTPSAAKTLDRLIDMFPPDDQPQVRSSLAAALRFVLAQRLLPAADGSGIVAAVELLTGVVPLAALIRDDKLFQIGSLQQRGRAFGMIRLDDSLAELVRAGRVTEDVALRAAEHPRELAAVLHPAAAAPATAPSGRGLADLKSRLGGIFGKKDRD
ncbi:MAG: PilT/PilU family type 4a pilus ATPase, partial [Kofleriaceae bacterium]|nr:PilT/PilU family type 4a pilus ATPase [Kofleriaceae bacterium]